MNSGVQQYCHCHLNGNPIPLPYVVSCLLLHMELKHFWLKKNPSMDKTPRKPKQNENKLLI